MWVELGNDNAVEGYRDAGSDDPELVRYREVDGQRITSVEIPDEMGLQEAFTTVVNAWRHHSTFDDGDNSGVKPAWVDSDSPGMKALLSEHFGLAQDKARPKTWGGKALADSPFTASARAASGK